MGTSLQLGLCGENLLHLKALFASLEGRGGEGFVGWKIRGKMEKSFKKFKKVVF